MIAVGPRQLSLLALSVGMVVLGALGLAGTVTPTPVLAAGLLGLAVILVFGLGRISIDFW